MGMLNPTGSEEISQKPDAPFLGADAGKGSFIGRSTEAFTLSANVKDGGIATGLSRAARGSGSGWTNSAFFNPSSIARSRACCAWYERAYAERDKSNSGAYVQEDIGNYLRGEPIPGIEYEYKLVQQLVPTITLADVNKLASGWISDDNRVIIAQSPEKEGVKVPTRAELLAVFDAAARTKVVAYTENLPRWAPLIERRGPRPGKIVSTKAIPGAGVTEWKLSNGARVLVKPTDFKADEVLLSATSPGGTSLASDADYMSAALSSQIVGLQRSGRDVLRDRPPQKADGQGGDGWRVDRRDERRADGACTASPKDLETMLQARSTSTSPRRVSTRRPSRRSRTRSDRISANRRAPILEQVFSEHCAVDDVAGTISARVRCSPAVTFAEVNPEKSLAFYKDRFADASDFTFVFVGNIDTLTLKPLVEKYIASLPAIKGQQGNLPRQQRRSTEGRVVERRSFALRRGAEGQHADRVHGCLRVRPAEPPRAARDG